MENERLDKNSAIILFLLITFLISGGYYVYKTYWVVEEKEVIDIEEQLKEQYYTMKIDVTNIDGNRIDANYSLYQSFLLLQDSEKKKEVREEFNKAVYNVSYSLYADTGEYYMNSKECYNDGNLSNSNDVCIVKLKKKGKATLSAASIDKDEIKIIIKVEGGIMLNPILCVDYKREVYNLFVQGLEKVQKPKRTGFLYNKCFGIGKNLEDSEYYYTVNFETTALENNLSIVLMHQSYDDKFQATYENTMEGNDLFFNITSKDLNV